MHFTTQKRVGKETGRPKENTAKRLPKKTEATETQRQEPTSTASLVGHTNHHQMILKPAEVEVDGEWTPVRIRDICGYVMIPVLAARQVGAASITLGAVRAEANKNGRPNFRQVKDIAALVGVPTKTCRNHLDKLVATGWLAKDGRWSNSNRRPLAAYRLTRKAVEKWEPYLALPNWFRRDDGRIFHFPEVCIYSFILSRWTIIESQEEIQGYGSLEERAFISIKQFRRETGLSKPSVIKALNHLEELEFVERGESYGAHNRSFWSLTLPAYMCKRWENR